MKQNIVISENLERSLVVAISECQHDRVFVLTDETTKRLCWPKLSSMRCMQEVTLITIPATDTNKNLDHWLSSGTRSARVEPPAIRCLSIWVEAW